MFANTHCAGKLNNTVYGFDQPFPSFGVDAFRRGEVSLQRRELALKYCGPKLRTSQIKAMEAQLGYRLPKDYCSFLLQHNGGTPKKRSFFKYKPRAEFANYVDRFFFIDRYLAEPSAMAAPGSLSRELYFRRNDNLQSDCLLIAQDETSDPILLGVKGRRRGKVLLQIVVEGADLIELEPGPSVFTLAKSFTEFLASLKATEEELI